MPATSQAQRRLIFGKRTQYSSKKNTPKKWKWIWGDEWENKGKLPEYKESRIYNFETFNEKLLNKIKNWINDIEITNSDSRLLSTDFNDKEIIELEKLGFIDNKLTNHHEFNFNSKTENLKITVKKYWDEYEPGAADPLYTINVNNKKYKNTNVFLSFINILKELIPEVKQDTNKYNL